MTLSKAGLENERGAWPWAKAPPCRNSVATVGDDKLEIDVAPWGEGHLKVNGREIAHIDDAKDRRQAFRELDKDRRALSSRGRHSNPIARGNPP